MRCAAAVGLAALAAFWATGAPAADDPSEQLVRMTDGAHNQTYEGIVVYRSGDMLETMRILHRFNDGKMRERLVSLTGEPREILRTDTEVTCILPRERRVTVDRRGGQGLFPSLPREKVEKLQQYYEFKPLGTARVAGRACTGVRIIPRDAFRYGYEFWVDQERGVPLKMAVVTPRGGTIEQLMFTEVAFPATIADKRLEPEVDATQLQAITHDISNTPASAQLAWVLQRMPPGFQVLVRDLRQLPGGQGSVEHLMLSDGISAVSIYSAAMVTPDKAFRGLSHIGAVHAYGRVVGKRHVTVVGEVPQETVQMIGDGLKPADVQSEPATLQTK